VSPDWVRKAALWAFKDLPGEIAVVMGNRKTYGILSSVEWGGVTQID